MHEFKLLCISVGFYFIAAYIAVFFNKFFKLSLEYTQGFDSNLEILRGSAAFLVFIAHTTMYFGWYAPKYMLSAWSGAVGVSIFFMLTAYLFWGQVCTKSVNFNTFYKKRVLRLVPLVIVFISIITIIDWILSGFLLPNKQQMLNILKNYGFAFAGVNDIFSENMFLRINVIWTLKWEWSLYLCLPILAIWPRKTTLLVAFFIFVLYFTDVNDIFKGESDVIYYASFLLGALAYYIKDYFSKQMRLYGVYLGHFCLFVGVTLLLYLVLGKSSLKVKSFYIIFSAYPFFLFFLLNGNLLSKFKFQGVKLIGKVSYSLYLWHLSINYYLVAFVKNYFNVSQEQFFSNSLNYALFGLVALLISLFVAFVSYKYIEEFFLSKKDKIM
ncbi:acyltransferase family protein [Neisseria sp. Ec49-e6-T10]|uniref:acyltransferase family protein n=1 Tax=Neisseria sp. Ec49-e6-T10 TaxID=3140744 RepID=UPI003EC0BA59